MSSQDDYFTRVPLVIPVALLLAGISFVMSVAPAQTLALRFSRIFFSSILTILPLSIIGLGGVIIYYGVKERKIQRKKITYSMIDIGSIIGLLGAGMFIFYLLESQERAISIWDSITSVLPFAFAVSSRLVRHAY